MKITLISSNLYGCALDVAEKAAGNGCVPIAGLPGHLSYASPLSGQGVAGDKEFWRYNFVDVDKFNKALDSCRLRNKEVIISLPLQLMPEQTISGLFNSIRNCDTDLNNTVVISISSAVEALSRQDSDFREILNYYALLYRISIGSALGARFIYTLKHKSRNDRLDYKYCGDDVKEYFFNSANNYFSNKENDTCAIYGLMKKAIDHDPASKQTHADNEAALPYYNNLVELIKKSI